MVKFMQIDEKALINDLRNNVLEILFELKTPKKDGNPNRLMKCTLQQEYFRKAIPTESERIERANFLADGELEPQKVRTLTVWDCDQHDWRSFRLDKIISINLTSA